MVGSLGTVAAPADFDFRLRARLANDSSTAALSLLVALQREGFAVAAVLVVFATGVVVVRNVLNQRTGGGVVAEQTPPPVPAHSPTRDGIRPSNAPASPDQLTAKVPQEQFSKN